MGFTIEPLLAEEEKTFLEGLNTCFKNWGEMEQFEWVFKNDCGAGPADLFKVSLNGTMIGGTGVTYRQGVDPRGRPQRMAIMTGSWVLPEARRQGCFTALTQTMIEAATARESALLLGFGDRANNSYRRLVAAGCAVIDSYYLRDATEFEPNEPPGPLEQISQGDRSRELYEGAPSGHLSFRYSHREWCSQFLHGPYPKAYLSLPKGALALVEEAYGFLRVLALRHAHEHSREVVEALLEQARSRRQRLFMYSLNGEFAEISEALGCQVIPGALFVKIADRGALSSWVPKAVGATEEELIDPGHPHYLGPAFFQNRDRM